MCARRSSLLLKSAQLHLQVEVSTGEVLRRARLPRHLFGEGLTLVNNSLLQLTWRRGTLLQYTDLDSFEEADFAAAQKASQRGSDGAAGVVVRDTGLSDGWGIAFDGEELLVTDSGVTLRWFDPARLQVARSAVVRDNGTAVPWLNELELIDGEVRPLKTTENDVRAGMCQMHGAVHSDLNTWWCTCRCSCSPRSVVVPVLWLHRTGTATPSDAKALCQTCHHTNSDLLAAHH